VARAGRGLREIHELGRIAKHHLPATPTPSLRRRAWGRLKRIPAFHVPAASYERSTARSTGAQSSAGRCEALVNEKTHRSLLASVVAPYGAFDLFQREGNYR
jgi:hypothetical protein